MTQIVVVGAGLIGASVTYHLARQGASVTLIDRAHAPAMGVTGTSFGWFSGAGGNWPGGAEDLRSSVLDDYRRLEAEVPGMAVRWSGSLVWTDIWVRLSEGTHLLHGQYWIERSEIAALEPNLQKLPDRAVYTPTDGGIDPIRTTEALIQAARALGAKLVLDSGVATLKLVNGRVEGVLFSTGFYPADTVILAAGADIGTLCEPLGVKLPIGASPAFWLQVAAPPGLVRTIVASPEFEVRESCDGHLLMTALHHKGASAAAVRQLARDTLRHLESSFGGYDQLRLIGHGVCKRPMPVAGPIIGYVRSDTSVYVAAMHSGVTLAPTVGRLVASELASGEPATGKFAGNQATRRLKQIANLKSQSLCNDPNETMTDMSI